MTQHFWYLFAAYTVIWAALLMYVVHLLRKNRELQHEIEDVRVQLESALARRGRKRPADG